MSVSNDPGHYFQTTTSLEESARKSAKSKNTLGNPIKLPSKILAIRPDPRDENCVYVAEAAGTVKKLNLDTSETLQTFTGPTAPLTSVAISPGTKTEPGTIYAGCWDKSIWTWNSETRKPGKKFLGHGDFVKTLLLVRVRDPASGETKELLVSGSADATISVWDPATAKQIHRLKGHSRAVLCLAVDPESAFDSAGRPTEEVVVFSASSDRTIRRWKISLNSAKEEGEPIIRHETSIDSLFFDADADLWTASADKSVKCLTRDREWEEDLSLEHPDFVRDVVVDEVGGNVVTACRDEGVRVFDRASGKLRHVFEGHYEEVTGLVILGGQRVVSVAIDGTVRTWSLKAQELEKAIKEAEDQDKRVVKEEVVEKKEGLGMLTEEEEAELAELMGDSD